MGRLIVEPLYHYTSVERWLMIEESGYLRPTESNLSQTREHAGPDVVWLTTDPVGANGHGLGATLDGTDKTAVRITVELPAGQVHNWKDWAIRRGIDRQWLARLSKSGGSSTWRVVEGPVTREFWTDVHVRADAAG